LQIVGTARLARLVRERGHLAANIDPLGARRTGSPDLDPATHGVTDAFLASIPSQVVGGPCAEHSSNAFQAVTCLREVYSGTVGYETDHIQIEEERKWLWSAIESRRFFQGIDTPRKRDLLERLTEVETFEKFLDTTFIRKKRFSIEGADMLVPMLDEIVHAAAISGTREVVIGMAHRGRLNVMAHVLGKSYAAILGEFLDAESEPDTDVAGRDAQGWSGDVKYHLGATRKYKESGIAETPITLVPNPSHLEFVNPVVEGHTRAAQDKRKQSGPPIQDDMTALAVAIHGDAAFPGQGIVPETLNLWNLPGFCTGGTIHIIVNNQIGFTTLPDEARSTLYAGDLAKGFEIPIVHVNADDPVACIAVTRMAHAYREQFHKDFLIDLIGYRRYGHNEGDAPEFTQPQMYEKIASHPRVRQIMADRLIADRLVTAEEVDAMIAEVRDQLEQARREAKTSRLRDDDILPVDDPRPVETSVPADQLLELNAELTTVPAGFTPHPNVLKNVLMGRREAIERPGAIDWGHAEALAFAAILADGTPIRLTGQDCERGTFSHRHAVIHDVKTGATYTSLQRLHNVHASFAVHNSPLSENAVLGFEYGYSMHAPGVLVLWEAQFGDFANGAQVIIDQFIVSGAAKWRQRPSLVLLLPHGYEGQGPEHSSARLERFLQLAANDNIRVANCTTAGQYFHLIRRQAALLTSAPRPLIVMTPKMLLRHPKARVSLDDLVHGMFRPVLDDVQAGARRERVTRLVLCSGKIFVDFEQTGQRPESVAVVRIEELYPFPAVEIRAVINGYPNLREIVWMQEEPENMGAWRFIAPRLTDPDQVAWNGPVLYVGRPESASPAEGSMARHQMEQARIISAAIEGAAELATARR
jgi:2-oxoglutarate dehydrogenase E1 component